MSTTIATVLLAHQDPGQERVLRTGLMSQDYAVRTLRRDMALIAQIDQTAPDPSRKSVLLLDTARVAEDRMSFLQVAEYLRARHPSMQFALLAGRALAVNSLHQNWAASSGALGVFARASQHRFVTSQRALLESLAAWAGRPFDVERLKGFEAVLHSSEEVHADGDADIQRAWDRLEHAGVDPVAIGESMIDPWGVRSEDRNYRGTNYPHCFTGSDAARWLNTRLALPRAAALLAGEVARSAGVFYHVARDHPLKDANLYYRGNRVSDRLRALECRAVVEEARSLRGVGVKDRNWRGVAFPRCFVGSEAAHWFMDRFGLTLGEAITLGQSLLDLHIFRHVTDDHDFIDGDFYYRFSLDRP